MANGKQEKTGEATTKASAKTAQSGNTVSLDYEGRLESGEVFDSSMHGDHSHPLEFTIGNNQVIPGFESAVKGMKVGEQKEFKIKPEEAYGNRDERMMREFPRNVLPQDQEPKEGMTLVMSTPDGHQIPAKIAKVTPTHVTIDLNHPLAGKTLIFKITLISIS